MSKYSITFLILYICCQNSYLARILLPSELQKIKEINTIKSQDFQIISNKSSELEHQKKVKISMDKLNLESSDKIDLFQDKNDLIIQYEKEYLDNGYNAQFKNEEMTHNNVNKSNLNGNWKIVNKKYTDEGKKQIDQKDDSSSKVRNHKAQWRDTIYLLIYAFFFLFVIEISMVIVFFFKQNKSYIANHMTLNFFCMLGQTINNIVFYSKKKDFKIEDWSFWLEVGIFVFFILQIMLGNMLNKRLLNSKIVRKIFILRFLHRFSGVVIYLGTKTHIFLINYNMFYADHEAIFYILCGAGCLFYIFLYLGFFLCLLDVKHYEFNGPFLADTSKNGKALKEMLINIENGDFEPPNLRQSFEMKVEDFSIGKKCPFQHPKSKGNDGDFFGKKFKQNLDILPTENNDDIEIGKVKQSLSKVNPIVPWFMLEDKIFDLRNLRHPKGLYVLHALAYRDITRELHGLKSMRFENKDQRYFRNLQHCHVNRTFHLIKNHCIGFIDTNKNLIIKDKSRKLLQQIKNDLREHKNFIKENQEGQVTDEVVKGSVVSNSSYNSSGSTASGGMFGNFMNYLEKNSMKNKYSHSWVVHSKSELSNICRIDWIWTKNHNFLINMKNYWLKNFGKYFFLKTNDLKQYHYICMSAHPKYLARKYLTFSLSPDSVLNYQFIKMPAILQSMIKSYTGFNLLDMAVSYSDIFLPGEILDAEENSNNSLTLLSSMFEKKNTLKIETEPLVEYLNNSFVKDKSIFFETPDEISSLDTPLSQFIPLITTPLNSVPLKKNILETDQEFDLKSGLGLGLNFGNFINKKVTFIVKNTGIVPILDFLEILLQVRILQLSNLMRERRRTKKEENSELLEFKKIENRLNFVRQKVDEFKEKAGVPGDPSDFTYDTIRPFDEEYLLTFSNRPQFRIYWELNLTAMGNQKNIYELLGLQILKEFEVVDALVDELSQTISDTDYIPSGIQALDEEDEILETEEENVKESETENEENVIRIDWEGNGFGSSDVPKLLHKVVINTQDKFEDEFLFNDKLVSVVNKDLNGVKQIVSEIGATKVEKLILSGSDEFKSRVLKNSSIPLRYVNIL